MIKIAFIRVFIISPISRWIWGIRMMKGSKEMTKIGFFLLLALAFLLLFIMGDCHVTGTQVLNKPKEVKIF